MTDGAVSASVKAKADRYLTEGRVAAVKVTRDAIEFHVAGSGAEPYRVRYLGEWACTCPAQKHPCAHIVAVQKVTKVEPARRLLFSDATDDLSQFIQSALS